MEFNPDPYDFVIAAKGQDGLETCCGDQLEYEDANTANSSNENNLAITDVLDSGPCCCASARDHHCVFPAQLF